MTGALTRLGVHRIPVPVPFPEAGGPANVYVIEEKDGGVALFDAGIGTKEGRDALHAGLDELGISTGELRRIFELLLAGPLTPAELAPKVFPQAREHQLYLTLSEVLGNLEVLEAQRRVARGERQGRIYFEAV